LTCLLSSLLEDVSPYYERKELIVFHWIVLINNTKIILILS